MPKNRASHKLSYAGPLPVDGAKPSPLTQRWAALAAFVAIVLIFLLYYGGQAWLLLITDLLLEGAFAAYWLACATLAGWFLLDLARLTRRDPRPTTSLLLPTAAALGFGIIGLLTLALGLAGVLNHWTASGLLLALALPQSLRLVMRPPSLQIGQWLRERTTAGFLWLPVAPFLAISLAGAMLPPGLLWKNADDPHPYDVLEYHLQVPREWYEAGRILPLHHNAFSFFPMAAEMHDLLAMHLRGGPWDGMYLAQLMSVTFMTLTILSIYGVCRTILKSRGDDSRTAPTLAAALAAVIPWTTLLAPVAYVEGAMLLFATLSIGWALIAFNSHDHRFRQMALAGALAGFACGVKYTALPMLLLALPPSLRLSRRPAPQAEPARPPAVFSPLLLFLFSGLLTFSPWLIRNALWTGGNPVFPEAMPLLGRAHFSPDQVDRWQQAHSPRPDQRSLPARLHAGWDQIVADWRYGYALLPLGLIAALLARRHPETRTLLILLLITTGIWLFATHLQSRFFILALPLCALVVGLAPWRRRWFIPAAVIALAALPSFLTLNDQLTPFLGPFGVTDFKDAMPPAYVKLAGDGRDLALVGQAQAFWYQLPMTRLSYRTVFDVAPPSASNAPDPLSPWLGPNPRPGQWLLVYPTELERFSKTYAHIPPPPPNLLGQPEPVVIPPK